MRYLIYRLVDVLVARHRNSLKASLGETFLRGYLKLVEGEKDPRNLLYCFATDWVLLREFEMSRELGEVSVLHTSIRTLPHAC
jgi:DNA repair/transcription protein MET18/MMS19